MKTFLLILSLIFGTVCVHAAPPNVAAKMAHLPPAVQKTIRDQQGASRLVDVVVKKNESDEAVYSVKISKDGKGRTFTVSLDGSVCRMPVALGETPETVQKIIKTKTSKATLDEINKVTERGVITYEIDFTQGTRERDFTVNNQGQLLTEKVFFEELPTAMQKTITAKSNGATVEDITKTYADDEVTFEVELAGAEKKRSLTLSASGEVVGEQVFLEELPEEAQKLIKEKTLGGKLGDITKLIEDEEITFDVEMTKNGQTRNFTLDEDGVLIGMQVFLAETPGPVQKTLQAQMKEAKLGTITRIEEGDEVTFQVEMRRNGSEHNFSVNTNGLMLDLEVTLATVPAAVKQAILAKMKTNEIDGITKTFEEDKESYEVEFTTRGKARLLSFDPKGVITHEEESLNLTEAPEPVRKAVQGLLTKARLLSITKTTEEGKVSYEIELDENGEGSARTLDGDGKVIDPDGQ